MFKTKIQDKVRDHLIQKCDFNCYAPDYLLSIDYFSDYSRQEIQKNHKWITKVVSDVFNPYDRTLYYGDSLLRRVRRVSRSMVNRLYSILLLKVMN